MAKGSFICGFTIILMVSYAQAQTNLRPELGVLSPETLATNNPATGAPWRVGDTYHLAYVTTDTTNALSTRLLDYNAFVSADADAEGMGAVPWFVMGSTATTDAVDNGALTGPMFNVFDNGVIATSASDFWNLDFSSSANPTTLDGSPKNLHTGTRGGGVARGTAVLGATGGQVAISWSAWTDWNAAWRAESTSDLKPLLAISEELEILPPRGVTIIIH